MPFPRTSWLRTRLVTDCVTKALPVLEMSPQPDGINATCTSVLGSLTCLTRGQTAGIAVSIPFVRRSLTHVDLSRWQLQRPFYQWELFCIHSFSSQWVDLQLPFNNNHLYSLLPDGDRKLIAWTPIAFSAIPWTYSLYVFFVALWLVWEPLSFSLRCFLLIWCKLWVHC